ncbi:hypothetical protein FVE85_5399 [Porphyridium purpureum]|uniref:Uncharacterized protein n=1 Tax=Porphyridium purpureum TaxID=35688 RepID=A0A5J4Z4F7_PORPP|nr:hypothetical protein FVE85_5399 [Porphyridium purpureum]|eukprot:POR8007..scf295_1
MKSYTKTLLEHCRKYLTPVVLVVVFVLYRLYGAHQQVRHDARCYEEWHTRFTLDELREFETLEWTAEPLPSGLGGKGKMKAQHDGGDGVQPVRNPFATLAVCGFLMVDKAYDPQVLSQINATVRPLVDDPTRFEPLKNTAGLRGKRVEFSVPHEAPFLQAIPPQPVMDFVRDFVSVLGDGRALRQKETTDPEMFAAKYDAGRFPALEQLTVILAEAREDTDQGLHPDASFRYGMKIHVPLVDVTEEMGPVRIYPQCLDDADGVFNRLYDWYSSLLNVRPSVLGTVPVGTAVIYQQFLLHQGTGNKSPLDRPILDFSLLPAHYIREHNYTKEFPQDILPHLKKYRQDWHARLVNGLADPSGRHKKLFESLVSRDYSIRPEDQKPHAWIDAGKRKSFCGQNVDLVSCLNQTILTPKIIALICGFLLITAVRSAQRDWEEAFTKEKRAAAAAATAPALTKKKTKVKKTATNDSVKGVVAGKGGGPLEAVDDTVSEDQKKAQ